MFSAHLDLVPWKGPPPSGERFGGELPVLWLRNAQSSGWLEPLRGELGAAGRLWEPLFEAVPVPGPSSVANPWAFRPDTHAPLRWGDPGRDIRRISDHEGAPSRLSGAVFDAVLGSLGPQGARTLLTQVAELLPLDAHWLVLDRNGTYLPQVARSLRQSGEERGEGRGTWRSAQEYRRLLEVAGLGISGAWGLADAPGAGRRLRRALPAGLGWPWLLLDGQRIGSDARRSGVE